MTDLNKLIWLTNLDNARHDIKELLDELGDDAELEVDLDNGECILTMHDTEETIIYEDIPTLIYGLMEQGTQNAKTNL